MTQIHSIEEREPNEQTRWFPPGVRGIGLASFLADVGHEVPNALFASLVTVTLGAPASVLGLMEGLAPWPICLPLAVARPLADTSLPRSGRCSLGWQQGCGSSSLTHGRLGFTRVACPRTQCAVGGYGPKRSLRACLRLQAHDRLPAARCLLYGWGQPGKR